MSYYIITIVLLLIIELGYFKIAKRLNIVDRPNVRSSHSKATIRGGGIIFPFAIIIQQLFFGADYLYFGIGLLSISFISFIDDLKPVSNKLRLLIHLASVGLMFYQLGIFDFNIYVIVFVLILVVGIINAVNFMDGINGMTGGYAFVTLLSLLYINIFVVQFSSQTLIFTSIIAMMVFNFFNFRNKAVCFAGDIGSVSIAFVITFLIAQLVIITNNPFYILILLIYGLDTITTIIFRIIRHENIFDAHRSHYYQYLANIKKIPHVIVSLSYSIMQLFFNCVLIFILIKSWCAMLMSVVIVTFVFIFVRFRSEGKKRLMIKYV